jgi:hypothetical protein
MAKKTPTTVATRDASDTPTITIVADSTSAPVALPADCDLLTHRHPADEDMVLHRRVVTLPELNAWLETPKGADRAAVPALINAWLALRPLETRKLSTLDWMRGEVARLRKAGLDAGLLLIQVGRARSPAECAIFINRGGVA